MFLQMIMRGKYRMKGDPSDWDRPSRRSRNQPAILGYCWLLKTFVFCICIFLVFVFVPLSISVFPSDWDRPSRRSRNQPAILKYLAFACCWGNFLVSILYLYSICICICIVFVQLFVSVFPSDWDLPSWWNYCQPDIQVLGCFWLWSAINAYWWQNWP